MQRIQILLTFILSVCLFTVQPALAAPPADVTGDQPVIAFPNAITFRARISADVNIASIVLEYGTDQLTCGEVIAKAFPQFNPSRSVEAEWTWDMRQSGSLPPGAVIWWRWRYTDENGRETLSDRKTITWLDSRHNWQTLTQDKVNLHWYSGSQTFARELLGYAQLGLERNKRDAGITPDEPIDIYVYPDFDNLRESVLYVPSWTGGMAFSDHNIVLIGITENDPVWNQNVIVHELTHVLVGNLTFSCLGALPTWLSEGLAVYSEGGLDKASQEQLDGAIRNNTLLSVRSLSVGFSELADKATLSYSQSYSIVKFLIETYERENMNALLTSLRDGLTIDEALLRAYGFNVEGLEDAWRKAIHAQPRPVSAQPTAQPTPTHVPTIVPVSGAPVMSQITPTPIPTSAFDQQPTQEPVARGRPPLALTLALLGFCCLFLLILGVIGLGIFVRAENRKRENNG